MGLAAVAHLTSISDPRPHHRMQLDLKELFVHPDHRGAKVGEALIHWIMADARSQGASRIDLHVRVSKSRGRAFYDRLGALEVDDRLSLRFDLTVPER